MDPRLRPVRVPCLDGGTLAKEPVMKSSDRLVRLVAILAACGTLASAQCGSLPTVYNGGTYCTNGGGPMFDVVALNPAGVHVTGFDVNLNAGTHAISIYVITGGGTFVGSELTAAAWTLVGTATALSTGSGGPTAVPLPFDVFVPGGATQGFHVRAAAGGLRYSGGLVLGSVFAVNADLQVLVGKAQCSLVTGGGPPFQGNAPSPRLFNGTVRYGREYQVNSPASSLDVDGLQGTSCSAANAVRSPGAPVALAFGSTNTGLGFEVLIAAAPLVPLSGGGLQTPAGQILNADLTAPFLLFLNGGAIPNLFNPFPGPFTLGFTAPPSPFTASAQMFCLDPLNPDGFVISQGVQLSVL